MTEVWVRHTHKVYSRAARVARAHGIDLPPIEGDCARPDCPLGRLAEKEGRE